MGALPRCDHELRVSMCKRVCVCVCVRFAQVKHARALRQFPPARGPGVSRDAGSVSPPPPPTPRRSSDKTKRETRRTVQTRPASALCFNTHTRSHTHTHVFIAESVHTHTYNRLHTHTRRATNVAALGIELSKTERERSEQILRAPPNLRTSPSKVRLAPAASWRQRAAVTRR